ncbi:glycosyltransferase [Polynucleobacter sp. UK-Mo-2m-Kol15]|uniref:glycosyltransferase n=1 Tax=Polynucleobacter sp. UK-Mo-2m-Kol15 TaxID=2576916 RepID=UPI001C0AC583|nr:glycosyltransferase [Polynucleobacter sp. UK-Mo-2m-Kol15]MBU3574763.1 glycosyltransferase [Polynucleobacter sp. UK-Mo-2m-Kol15]
MRILHIYRTYYPDSQGGIQEAIRQICLATQAHGVQSRILTLSPNPTPLKLPFPEGEVIRSRSWMAPASCDMGGLNSLIEYQRLIKWADVIHYHFPWPFLDILQLSNFSKKPSVLTYHSDIVKQRFLKRLYSPLMHHTLRAMSIIIATSPNYLESSPVLRKYFSKGKVTVIPLGISRPQANFETSNASDEEYLNQIGVKSGHYLLFLGVLRHYKGVHSLVSVAQSVQGKIVIAGDGPEIKALMQLSNHYQLKNVVFLGEVTEHHKHLLLQHCTALVLPSQLRSEAFGMVLIEASMHAKAMICCELGSGTSYVNIHGLTGLVVPPKNPAALSEACNQLLNNPTLAKKMGHAALERYESLFSANSLGKSHVDVYSQVIGISPKKPSFR